MIPVYRPFLPTAAAVCRYLERLDSSRQYSNRGELAILLESRLGERLGCARDQLLVTGSGTAALIAAILAAAGRASAPRSCCLASGYSFVAGVQAAELCGYRPYFVDVDPATWSVPPDAVAAHAILDRVGLILITAPYGVSVPVAAWDDVSRRTGIPVVIDAAASVERFAGDVTTGVSTTPAILSFHATKAFACGEGGAILSSRSDLLTAAAAALNFGFAGVRETSMAGFNGKMSEYHAAVGLAELDGWDVKRAALAQVAETYRAAAARMGVTIHTAPRIGSNYVLLEATDAAHGAAVRETLARNGVDSRLWYGEGLHREPYFRGAARDPLPNVEHLAPRLIGLPVASDLPPEEIDTIVRCAATA